MTTTLSPTEPRLELTKAVLAAAEAGHRRIVVLVGRAGVPKRTQMGSARPYIVSRHVVEDLAAAGIAHDWSSGAFHSITIRGADVSFYWLRKRDFEDVELSFRLDRDEYLLTAEITERLGHDMDVERDRVMAAIAAGEYV